MAEPDESGGGDASAGGDGGAEYTPVVKLGIIAVSDGEENLDVLYKQKALLRRFDSDTKEWKERGKGDVRLMQQRDTKKVRIILRQQKTLKIRMHHIVAPACELKQNTGSDRSWTWVATDYSDEVAKIESFAISFRDSDVANDFKAKFDIARKINAGDKSASLPVIVDTPDPEDAPAKKDGAGAAAGGAATATPAVAAATTATAAVATPGAAPAAGGGGGAAAAVTASPVKS